jgi:hypothetical protein
MLVLGSKLNRLYTLYLPFNGDYCEIGVIFNKSNTFIGFNLDSRTYNMVRNEQIKSSIFQEINQSAFATTFLDLRDYRSRTLDIKQQFNNIQPQFKDQIQYETNETIKLSKIQIKEKIFESCLFIYIFKFVDFGNEFIYCLCERQHIDVVMNKKIVRTAGVQLCTNDRYEELTDMIEANNKDFARKTESVDEVIHNVFEERKNLNTERF